MSVCVTIHYVFCIGSMFLCIVFCSLISTVYLFFCCIWAMFQDMVRLIFVILLIHRDRQTHTQKRTDRLWLILRLQTLIAASRIPVDYIIHTRRITSPTLSEVVEVLRPTNSCTGSECYDFIYSLLDANHKHFVHLFNGFSFLVIFLLLFYFGSCGRLSWINCQLSSAR